MHPHSFYDRSLGYRAESWAVFYLRCKGYGIIQRRYRHYSGEIDIIAVRRHCLVFIEVKYRKVARDGYEAITPFQKRRIQRAAQAFIARHPRYHGYDMRFDLIIMALWRWPIHLRHIWD